MSRGKTGCKNCMVAQQTISEDGVKGFKNPEKILDLEEFSYNYTYAEGSKYADNKQIIYKKKPTGVDVSLTFSDLSLEMEATLMGKRYASGGSSTNINDQAKPVALLLQETYDDGSYTNIVFYNVKLSKDENSGKTEGENIEFTPVTLKGRGLPFTNNIIDGDIDFKMDSADPKVNKEKLNSFFTSVQYLDALVSVVYTGYTTGEVTEISIAGVTFDTASKTFLKVPSTTTKFTFKLGSAVQVATKNQETWTFAAQ